MGVRGMDGLCVVEIAKYVEREKLMQEVCMWFGPVNEETYVYGCV